MYFQIICMLLILRVKYVIFIIVMVLQFTKGVLKYQQIVSEREGVGSEKS